MTQNISVYSGIFIGIHYYRCNYNICISNLSVLGFIIQFLAGPAFCRVCFHSTLRNMRMVPGFLQVEVVALKGHKWGVRKTHKNFLRNYEIFFQPC